MRDPYISRHYLREKYDHIKWCFENVFKIEDEELDDGIPYDVVKANVRGVLAAWEAIAKELTQEPYPEPGDLVSKDLSGTYNSAVEETKSDIRTVCKALSDFVEKEKLNKEN